MGRFYKTAQPHFAGNNAGGSGKYNTLIALMQQEVKERGAKNAELLQQSSLYEKGIDSLKYLGIESETMKAEQGKYRERLKKITNQFINNPNNINENQQELLKLGEDLKTSMRSGNIYNMQNRYNQVQKFIESNKDFAEKNPSAYNELFGKMMKNLETDLKGNPEANIKNRMFITRPDVGEEYFKIFDGLPDNTTTHVGKEFITKSTGVSRERVEHLFASTLMGHKNYADYARQQGDFLGKEGYLTKDKDGKVTGLLGLYTNNYKGKEISNEEYNKLDDKEKKKVTHKFNKKHAFYNEIKNAGAAHMSNKSTVVENPITAAQVAHQNKIRLKSDQEQFESEKDVVSRSITERVFPLGSSGEFIDNWRSLNIKFNNGEKLSDEDQIKYAALNDIFGDVIDESGQELLEAFGLGDVEEYKLDSQEYKSNKGYNKEAREMKIMEIINHVNNLRKDSEYGKVKAEKEKNSYIPYGNSRDFYTKDTSLNINTKKAKQIIDDKYGSIEDFMIKNTSVVTQYLTPNKRQMQKLIADLEHSIQFTTAAGISNRNLYGDKRNTMQINIDGEEKASNIISQISSLITKDIPTLFSEDYFNVLVSSDDVDSPYALYTATPKLMKALGKNEIEGFKGDRIIKFKSRINSNGKFFEFSDNAYKNTIALSNTLPNFNEVSHQFNIGDSRVRAGQEEFITIHSLNGYNNLKAEIKFDEENMNIVFKRKNNDDMILTMPIDLEEARKKHYTLHSMAIIALVSNIYDNVNNPDIVKKLTEANNIKDE